MDNEHNKSIKNILEKKDGYTMIVVLCLLCLFAAMALSIIFSASLLVSRANRAADQEQSRVSAISFSKRIESQLNKSDSDLCKYILRNLDEGWPYYNPGEAGHGEVLAVKKKGLTFSETDVQDKVGELTMEMFWEPEDELNPDYKFSHLAIKIKAVVGEEQYSVTARYANFDELGGSAENWYREENQ